MGNRSNVIRFADHSMNKIEKRVNELLDKLQIIGTYEDAKSLKAAIPIWFEITELRGKQLEYMDSLNEKTLKELAEAHEDMAGVRAIMNDHEERLMEIESIPMTENLAQAFIIHMGLEDKFEAFMEAEIDRVTTESLAKGTNGAGGLH